MVQETTKKKIERWECDDIYPDTQELLPYDECPKCGEYRYRKCRHPISIWWNKGYYYWMECKYCRYKKEL